MERQILLPENKSAFGIIGARLGTGNMGVGALAMGAISVALSAYPGAKVFVLDYDSEPEVFHAIIAGEIVDIPLVNIRFSKNIFLENHILRLLMLAVFMRMIPVKGLRSFILSRNARLADIARADRFLSITGGDSFTDIYGFERFLYVVLPQILCLLLNIPLIHLPQTWGPIKNPVLRSIAAAILSRSHTVYSRDQEGIAFVRELQKKLPAPKEARFGYDLGFILDPRKPPVFNPEFESLLSRAAGNIVGINISGLLWMGGYTRSNMFGLAISYPDFTRRLIRYFIKDRKVTILLVPHVFAVGKSKEADTDVCKTVFDELHGEFGDSILFDQGSYDQNEIKYLIGKTSFFVGARMHACIAALSQSIPAVGIAYSKKFKGVLSSIGVPELVVDPSLQTEDELLASIAGLYDRREDFARVLRVGIPDVKKQVLELLKGVQS